MPFPVGIDEFIEAPEFLGYMQGDFEIWPAHVDRIRRMNPDVVLGDPPVQEYALGGSPHQRCTQGIWVSRIRKGL